MWSAPNERKRYTKNGSYESFFCLKKRLFGRIIFFDGSLGWLPNHVLNSTNLTYVNNYQGLSQFMDKTYHYDILKHALS